MVSRCDRVIFRLIKLKEIPNLYGFQQVIWATLALQILAVNCLASPYPGMGSSILLSPSKGYMFAVKKFEIRPAATHWILEKNSSEDSKKAKSESSEISVRFQDPKQSGSLLVQTKTLAQPMSIESYAKTWIRDYSAYGFDVLGTRGFTQNNATGFVVDLFHRKMNKQIRQVIFVKEKTSVTLTCTDNRSKFKGTLSSCNEILKTFRWL